MLYNQSAMKKVLISAAIILALAFLGYYLAIPSIPAQSQEAEFHSQKGEVIYVEIPQAESKIESPLVVRGRARGQWFFEASFPLVLTDWDGRIIAQSYAQAQGNHASGGVNWMTTEYVPFEGTLVFENPSWDAEFSKRGALIFQKDNPSGLPENDDAVELTVFFE